VICGLNEQECTATEPVGSIRADNHIPTEGGHRVFAQVADQLLGFGGFGPLGRWLRGGADLTQLAFESHSSVMRSEPLRWIYTPLTISSYVRRVQSSASRLVRKVLVLVGQPVYAPAPSRYRQEF